MIKPAAKPTSRIKTAKQPTTDRNLISDTVQCRTDLVLKPQTLHVVHVAIAIEEVTLQCCTRFLQQAIELSHSSCKCLFPCFRNTSLIIYIIKTLPYIKIFTSCASLAFLASSSSYRLQLYLQANGSLSELF